MKTSDRMGISDVCGIKSLARQDRLRIVALLTATVICLPTALARADSAVAWGYDASGQLGDGGTEVYSAAPVAVVGLASGITSVAPGWYHSLAVRNGGVYAWGNNESGQLGDNTGGYFNNVPRAVSGVTDGVADVAGGAYHSLALKNGAVYGWGYNYYGEVGDGSRRNNRYVPVAVVGLNAGVTSIAAGGHHNLAVKNGGLYAWGWNDYGQLGDGTTTERDAPVPVIGMSNSVTKISAGSYHSLTVKDGGVYAWGYNLYGELGDGSTLSRAAPVAVSGLLSGVTSVATGDFHSLAVKDGGVYAWGDNNSGQLGDGTTTTSITPERIDAADLYDIVAVVASAGSSYALSSDGSFWAWGGNAYGQLGLTVEPPYSFTTPQHLLPPAGYVFTSLTASSGGGHVVATIAAVPEPASGVLFALGGLGVGAVLLRRCLSTARASMARCSPAVVDH